MFSKIDLGSTLWYINIQKNYGKSPCSMGKSTISMAIFNSYVKLPEGKNLNILQFLVGLFSSWASATHGTSDFKLSPSTMSCPPPSSYRSNLRQPSCQHHTWLDGNYRYPLIIGYSLLWQMANLDDLLVKIVYFPWLIMLNYQRANQHISHTSLDPLVNEPMLLKIAIDLRFTY